MKMEDIVECVSVEDVFFDSVDLFTEEDNPVVNEVLRYEFWRDELRSVKERRDAFLSEMGLVESSSSSGSVEMGLVRMMDSSESGTGSCSCSLSSTDGGDGNLVADEPEHDQSNRYRMAVSEEDSEPSTSNGKSLNKRIGHWWKEMKSKREGMSAKHKCRKHETSRTKVHVNKKRVMELSALFAAQEIQAHKGIIWSMKFSPDGQYLASGGEDGVVRVWRVKTIDSCCDAFRDENIELGRGKEVKVPVVIPDKMFQIEEYPLQEFHGHAGDVLDLAWSNSNHLLSSSTDKTVRLWHAESGLCISTFLHTDYVTCIQFNPVDERYFISGSIDGKVRIWGVSTKRVLDWADVRDAVSALCYQPDGHGFVVGSLSGTCRFYETKGKLVELSAHIQIHSSKKSSTKRITGIQFFSEDSQRIMVMTEDSKLRIIDKRGLVCKYRGLPKSGGHMSASISSNSRHIVSIGEDSCVYMWNHDEPSMLSLSKHKKSNRSCERFTSDGVSVAISWSGHETIAMASATQNPRGFSLNSLFSSKSTSIWPEDMLPIFNAPQDGRKEPVLPSAWGLVFVTANCDGIIRTFHNYGLTVKV